MVSIITRDELKKLIDQKEEYTLIDVREEDELEYGMIPTAKNIPLSELGHAITASPSEFLKRYQFPLIKKEKQIIVYCRTGGRSGQAAHFLEQNGFSKVFNFAGSIWRWAEIDPNVRRYGPAPLR